MKFLSTIVCLAALLISMANTAAGCPIFFEKLFYTTNMDCGDPIHKYDASSTLSNNGEEVCNFDTTLDPIEANNVEIWMNCCEGYYDLLEGRNGDWDMIYQYGSASFWFTIDAWHFGFSHRGGGTDG